jgi:chromosome segregation ATPase
LNGALVQILGFSIAGVLCGVATGYFIAASLLSRRESQALQEAYRQTREAGNARDKAIARYQKAKVGVESARKHVSEALAQRTAAIDKLKAMQDGVKKLQTERVANAHRIKSLQNSLSNVHQRAVALQREAAKAARDHKRDLARAQRERERLETELQHARAEQSAFKKRVRESVLDHGTPEEMITAAQLRFGQIGMLERSNQRLETENAGLKRQIRAQENRYEALQKEFEDLSELRIHNQQLVRAVETLEQSRQHHEQEAEQFRSQADESEQLSETLRMRLSKLQESFAAMEQQQSRAVPGVAANQDVGDDGTVDVAGSSNGG